VTLNDRLVAWAQESVTQVWDRTLRRLVILPVRNGQSDSWVGGRTLVWSEPEAKGQQKQDARNNLLPTPTLNVVDTTALPSALHWRRASGLRDKSNPVAQTIAPVAYRARRISPRVQSRVIALRQARIPSGSVSVMMVASAISPTRHPCANAERISSCDTRRGPSDPGWRSVKQSMQYLPPASRTCVRFATVYTLEAARFTPWCRGDRRTICLARILYTACRQPDSPGARR